ncbi:hypothetical protein ES288_A01G061900v1 [Gossypium darwinii]|uniref:Purple acid phosphatase C-terminal domain-containing protein n=1 Tax=Gossypium darwinii TaxID=34276 RepID=A0A5D2HL04_GOSDA|nr:hypothetical protein ES288_A01G061900v1 [Gossypium darwinii]
MEGRLMFLFSEFSCSNLKYKVQLSSGERYPIPDKSTPVYITVGDGGNPEGLAGRFLDPQPEYFAFREASYGHLTLEIQNRTHAFYHWNNNNDGKKVEAFLECLNDIISKLFRTKYAMSGICCRRIDSLEDMVVFR